MSNSSSSAVDSSTEGNFLGYGLLRNKAKWPFYLSSIQPVKKDSINHFKLIAALLSLSVSMSRVEKGCLLYGVRIVHGSFGSDRK